MRPEKRSVWFCLWYFKTQEIGFFGALELLTMHILHVVLFTTTYHQRCSTLFRRSHLTYLDFLASYGHLQLIASESDS